VVAKSLIPTDSDAFDHGEICLHVGALVEKRVEIMLHL
ncbi:unnamed protein product, partial [Acidithrix sp. C25]